MQGVFLDGNVDEFPYCLTLESLTRGEYWCNLGFIWVSPPPIWSPFGVHLDQNLIDFGMGIDRPGQPVTGGLG